MKLSLTRTDTLKPYQDNSKKNMGSAIWKALMDIWAVLKNKFNSWKEKEPACSLWKIWSKDGLRGCLSVISKKPSMLELED